MGGAGKVMTEPAASREGTEITRKAPRLACPESACLSKLIQAFPADWRSLAAAGCRCHTVVVGVQGHCIGLLCIVTIIGRGEGPQLVGVDRAANAGSWR